MAAERKSHPDDDRIDELALAMLYIGSWVEGKEPLRGRRTWKGYPFDILNRLSEKELISDSGPRSKSVFFTEEGEVIARRVLERLGIEP